MWLEDTGSGLNSLSVQSIQHFNRNSYLFAGSGASILMYVFIGWTEQRSHAIDFQYLNYKDNLLLFFGLNRK